MDYDSGLARPVNDMRLAFILSEGAEGPDSLDPALLEAEYPTLLERQYLDRVTNLHLDVI
jgi:hypothetical protein